MIEMVELAGITIATETLLGVSSYFIFAVLIIYFYRLSNKRLMKKIKELKRKDKELYKQLEQINKARMREHREVNKKIISLQEKMGLALKPNSIEKELDIEKALLER
mgnify:CR=1 FL=1